MAKKKTLFENLMQAGNETLAFVKGEAEPGSFRIHVPGHVDVKALRHDLHLTQDAFAETFGFSPARVKDWEQERSAPDPAIRAYLTVIRKKPDMVLKILSGADNSMTVIGTRKTKSAPADKKRHLKSVLHPPKKKKSESRIHA